MGYSHGKKWTLEKVLQEVKNISGDTGIMPTFKQMDIATGNKGLSVAVSRYGGHKEIAEMIGLKLCKSETNFGRDYEIFCMIDIENRFGYSVKQMSMRHPYDLLVENSVKVDVKVSKKICNRNGYYFTFNLEKKEQTCDIFVLICCDNNDIEKTYIIPSVVLSGHSQLSIGIQKSVYDKYLDQWHFIKDYADFIRGTT